MDSRLRFVVDFLVKVVHDFFREQFTYRLVVGKFHCFFRFPLTLGFLLFLG